MFESQKALHLAVEELVETCWFISCMVGCVKVLAKLLMSTEYNLKLLSELAKRSILLAK